MLIYSAASRNLTGYGRKDYEVVLLRHFDKVIDIYLQLRPEYQRVITDVTDEMSKGMIECISNQYWMDTVAQYDTYCHYVAGLVGIGLTKMFAASGLETAGGRAFVVDEQFLHLANSMGLFLQKVNIIRDYLEDLTEDRLFWPRQIWSKHAAALADFAKAFYLRLLWLFACLFCVSHRCLVSSRDSPSITDMARSA